ncbi:MAG: hypothetical protein J5I52_07780 [Saprospiraceae bacterium]|nr:MAG: hypothetical protein UZ09_BCD002001626 [Bacteroidetes bacterium OLB9]MCO6464033.1 hypothetical protein [Saprospiraceae bacterium]MCZ2338424.1 hypothetical protein [Chitinophagales bacterium]
MRILVVLCFLFIGISLNAQIGPSEQAYVPPAPKEKVERPTTPAAKAKLNADKLTKHLKLTKTQHTQLHKVFLDFELEKDRINKDQKMTKRQKFYKNNEIYQKRQNDIKKILTPTQYREYQFKFA